MPCRAWPLCLETPFAQAQAHRDSLRRQARNHAREWPRALQINRRVPGFCKQRRFGRVEIFGLAALNHARAKTHHLSAQIADRKHNPVTKTVIATRRALCLIRFALDHYPRFNQRIVRLVWKYLRKVLPAMRRVAQSETLGDFAAQAAVL